LTFVFSIKTLIEKAHWDGIIAKAAIMQRIDWFHDINVNPDHLKLQKVVSLVPGACAF
jgi:hypothetical protein